jgi:hypothetical protein
MWSPERRGPVDPRVRAVLDLSVAEAREGCGCHEYDGQVQDLSPTGVAEGLARLRGAVAGDQESSHGVHDEAHLAAFEDSAQVKFGELELHRRNPLLHAENLDLSCYDRAYAPEDERLEARRRHLQRWPEAVDMAVQSLDLVPAPVATSLLSAVAGLRDAVDPDEPDAEAALAAHARLVDHVDRLTRTGDPATALGRESLERLMAAEEAMPDVDLEQMTERASAERRRLWEMLDEGCQRWAPGVSTPETVASLMSAHPPADGVVAAARSTTSEAIDYCRQKGWLPHLDGECHVGLAPPSRRWAVAMLSWSAPYETDGPSNYDITPPESSWPLAEQQEWLTMFSHTALPAVTTHEVAPGHFAHGRSLRHAPTEVRRSLIGAGFAEGWAHYGEELMLEEGFRSRDARYQIGVALEALVRVTRLSCAIGLHTGAMDVEDATRAFMTDALMSEATARSEARRGTFDPTYGIYTWGKWVIMDAREEARRTWGDQFSLRRFHEALLDLGSPPLGLVGAALAE